MPKPYELTVSQASQQIKEKKLSPVDLAQSLLERIDATESDLKAWATIDREEVLTTAKQLEEEASQGKSRGLLHGVPVGLKDIFYTAGMKTAAGSKVYADFVPDFDATSVAKIKEAGGIILGKAVTTEFAQSDPSPRSTPGTPSTHPAVPAAGRRSPSPPRPWAQRWVPRPAAQPAVRPLTTVSWASKPPMGVSAAME